MELTGRVADVVGLPCVAYRGGMTTSTDSTDDYQGWRRLDRQVERLRVAEREVRTCRADLATAIQAARDDYGIEQVAIMARYGWSREHTRRAAMNPTEREALRARRRKTPTT